MTPKLTLTWLAWQYDQSFHETHHAMPFVDPDAILYSGNDSSVVTALGTFRRSRNANTTLDSIKHQCAAASDCVESRRAFCLVPDTALMQSWYVGHVELAMAQPDPPVGEPTPYTGNTGTLHLPAITTRCFRNHWLRSHYNNVYSNRVCL